MAYDPRTSTIRSTSRPTPHTTTNATTTRQKRDEENSFMTLPDSEIAGCISDIGIPFSVADLHKPQPQQIQRVFEWFAELLVNATRDAVAPGMRAAAADACGQYAEIFGADTRDLMGFYVVLRRLLVECGVSDFTFGDLYRPTRERLVRTFSYVINFIRFRESQTRAIDAHFNATEETKARVETLQTEIQADEQRLRQLEANRGAAETAVAAKERRKGELKDVLNGLKAEQERVIGRFERARGEQGRLKGALEEAAAAAGASRRAAEKLRPYAEGSPGALEAALEELAGALEAGRGEVEGLERRARALQGSCDAFAAVEGDVRGCAGLLGELGRDMAAEEHAAGQASRGREVFHERSNSVRDVEREEKMLRKQLENVQRRTEKLRRNAEERREAEAKKMEELREVNEGIRRERGDKGREMERRRVRIEQTEKKMADLKDNIETEVHSAHDEYVKMDSHIRLYIKEMEQSIA